MEPTQAPIVFTARVIAVEEKFGQIWKSGVGPEAKFDRPSMGWFIGLSGSYEWLHVGVEKPNVQVGQTATVRISFD